MDAQRYRPAPNVVFDLDGDVALLLNDAGTHLVSLNEIGTAVWKQFVQPRSTDELTEILQSRFPDVPRARLERDCIAFVRELVSNGLVDAVG